MKSTTNIIIKSVNNKVNRFAYENNHKWKDSFVFIQMADTQLGLTNNDEKWDIEIKYSDKCVELINKMTPLPKFAIVCGDMINAFPFKPKREEQYSDFLKIFQKMNPNIPLLCVCGNHDIGNSPTIESIKEYRLKFGDEYTKFWVDGVKFIVINSQYIFDASQCQIEAKKHEEWLESELNHTENKEAKHFVVFQHIPWFNTKFDEADSYFSLPSITRLKWLDRFCESGVTKVFAGHLHYNFIGSYQGSRGGHLDLIVTTAIGMQLGKDTHGFRVVNVTQSNITQEFIKLIID